MDEAFSVVGILFFIFASTALWEISKSLKEVAQHLRRLSHDAQKP